MDRLGRMVLPRVNIGWKWNKQDPNPANGKPQAPIGETVDREGPWYCRGSIMGEGTGQIKGGLV